MRGIVYTAMPRGDATGSARFTDQQNRLSCSVDFGKIEGSMNPLLQRPDSLQGVIYSHDDALPASCSPDTQTVRLLERLLRTCSDIKTPTSIVGIVVLYWSQWHKSELYEPELAHRPLYRRSTEKVQCTL